MRKPLIAALTLVAIVPALALASEDRDHANDDRYRQDNRSYETDRGTGVLPQSWLPVSEIARSIEEAGYRIVEIDLDDGVWEVDAISPEGRRVETYVNPETGELLRGWSGD